MDELRWILLGLGALIIVGVYLHGSWDTIREKGWPGRWRKQSRDKDRLEPETLYNDEIIGEVRVTRFAEPELEPEAEPELEPELPLEVDLDPEIESVQQAPAQGAHEQKVIILTLMAPEGVQYAGDALAEVAESCGLKLTTQGVFRRAVDTDAGAVAAYTMANLLEPGTFEPDRLTEQMTPGVVLIMQLPGPVDGPSTFEQMLATARTVVDRLGGQLLDGRRCNLSAQSIEHIREELLEHRRKSQLVNRRD